jgi:hypothetical protein
MGNHSCLRSHLGRISIVKILICVCSRDFETVDHVLWGSKRFNAKMLPLWVDLRLSNTEWGTTIRDILGERDWRSLWGCCFFFRRCNLKIWTTDITWMDQSHNQTLNSFARGPSLWSLKKKTEHTVTLSKSRNVTSKIVTVYIFEIFKKIFNVAILVLIVLIDF